MLGNKTVPIVVLALKNKPKQSIINEINADCPETIINNKVIKQVVVGHSASGSVNQSNIEPLLTEAVALMFPDCADEDGKRVLIKLDWHSSRLEPSVLKRMRDAGIYLQGLLPNCTSKMQVMDVAGFRDLKSVFKKLVRNSEVAITKIQRIKMALIAYDAIDERKLREGWKVTGLNPFDMQQLLCLPEVAVNDELDKATENNKRMRCDILFEDNQEGDELETYLKSGKKMRLGLDRFDSFETERIPIDELKTQTQAALNLIQNEHIQKYDSYILSIEQSRNAELLRLKTEYEDKVEKCSDFHSKEQEQIKNKGMYVCMFYLMYFVCF